MSLIIATSRLNEDETQTTNQRPSNFQNFFRSAIEIVEAEAHRYLACSAYASPSKVYSVLGHEGRMVPLTIWPIRDQQSWFDGGWKAWHKIDWHVLVARLVTAGGPGCQRQSDR